MSSSPLRLLVGLGNPGKEYADTRHNAGAWFITEFAHAERVAMRHEAKFHGLRGSLEQPPDVCQLLIPSTFMNLSGQSVRSCMSYYKIPPEAMLVAHDDIDLPVGTVRIKFDGGDGGHNGLKDIIRHLNTKQFYRLRIGVGHPGQSKDVSDYVLAPPSKADRQRIDDALHQVYAVLPLLLAGEFQKAAQQLHTAPPTIT